MLTLAWVRFRMACVTIVARISRTTEHFMLRAMGATHVNFSRVHVAQNNILLASALVCTLSVECVLR